MNPERPPTPERQMTADEIAIAANARLNLMEALLPGRWCTCENINCSVFVCAQHWCVHRVVLRHEHGCASLN